MLRPFRKPLIIMTPKSLLRHKLAVSQRSDFIGEAHFRRIMSDRTPPEDAKVKRVVLCSGKVGYDLMEARDAAGLDDTTVIRIEQIYPFPGEALAIRLKKMKNLEEVVWAQIEESLIDAGHKGMRARYAGRAAAASPATGLMSRHQTEQAALVADALGLNVRAEIRRNKNKA